MITTPTDATPTDTTSTDTRVTDTGPTDTGPRGEPAPGPAEEPARFDPRATRIAVVLREDLPVWQRLNVTAFLSGGLAGAHPGLIGEPYEDADGTRYAAMFRQPVVVREADGEALRAAHRRAVDRGLTVAVFTADLFATGNDRDNRAAVRGVPRDRLDLVGLAVHGPRNAVDRALKGTRMHS
ncbi:DUF2000 domain-containing protein [Streptomyces calidiresistens]|uniref:DUF2000 family protein n=1 Tax=Streptomyces calidiresistens TaxID=1485586 RepID=A0A7W3XWY0_9ACTN|nr:DUF2000 domain-containing protein [Streptomyces calidiresistens]MBB0230226.1 DUF2000 family protein [Streptomyces calidiresistens]